LGHFGRFSGPGDPFLLSSVEYFRMADIFGPSRHSAHLAHLCRRRPHGQVLEPIVMRVAFSGFS